MKTDPGSNKLLGETRGKDHELGYRAELVACIHVGTHDSALPMDHSATLRCYSSWQLCDQHRQIGYRQVRSRSVVFQSEHWASGFKDGAECVATIRD